MAAPRKPRPFPAAPTPTEPEQAPVQFAESADSIAEAVAESLHNGERHAQNVLEIAASGLAGLEVLDPIAPAAGMAAGEGAAENGAGLGAIANGVQEMHTLALDAFRENMEANLSFVTALAQSKSLSEAVSLQTAHLRQRYEAVSGQWRTLAGAAQRILSNDAAAGAPRPSA